MFISIAQNSPLKKQTYSIVKKTTENFTLKGLYFERKKVIFLKICSEIINIRLKRGILYF